MGLNSRRVAADAALGSGALVLTAATNHLAGVLLAALAPQHAWLATTAAPSCLMIAVVYAIFGKRDALHWPRLPLAQWRRPAALSLWWLLAWLVGCAVAAAVAGHRIIYAQGWPMISALMVFGPLGEELLFRGLVFQRVRTRWPAAARPAILMSTILFSLHHLTINTAPDGLRLAQLLFTIPMGAVFAVLRERTGSLWPGLMLHMMTNLTAV